MARSIRIEYPGAFYHITSRGNAQKNIFLTQQDRGLFLELLHKVCKRHHWVCHAYCLMDNHYHLLIETQSATLSKGMKMLNGNYTQSFNFFHKRVGHVFQGRFKAIIVDKDNYFLELARYIVLNPVRAKMVYFAKDWPWSSYRATAGFEGAIDALTIDQLLLQFGQTRKAAQKNYQNFIKNGKNQPSPWENLKNQVYLGSEDFVNLQLKKISTTQSLNDIPNYQKQPMIPLGFYKNNYRDQKEAMARAYLSGHYTLKEIASEFKVGASTVGRAVNRFEN